MRNEVTSLVTGGTGFLGRAVVRKLMCEGIGLRCLVRPNCPKEAIGELRSLAAATGARLEIVTGNLGSPDDVAKAMEEVQTVYHMAAEMRGMAANIFFN